MLLGLIAFISVQVIDISGKGYNDIIWETSHLEEANVIKGDLKDCDVFKDQDEDFYRVICKSKEYITKDGKTFKEVN